MPIQLPNRTPEESETIVRVDVSKVRLRVVCQNCGRVARIDPLMAGAPGAWQNYDLDVGTYTAEVWLCPPCVGRGASVRLWV